MESGNLAYFRICGDRALANMRRAGKAVPAARRSPLDAALRAAAYDMEMPLREARHLVRVNSVVDPDSAAEEVQRKLEIVDRNLRRIYALFRR